MRLAATLSCSTATISPRSEPDLGFTDANRIENVRRVANVAQLMAEAGLIVIVALISPFERDRLMARNIAGDIRFVEIFVDAPLEVCIERDTERPLCQGEGRQVEHFTGFEFQAIKPPKAPGPASAVGSGRRR